MTAPRVEAGPAASARPIEGILWMALTSVLFVVMDAIAKSLTIDYPVNQITWARFSFHALFIALYLNLRLPSMLKSAALGLQLLRSSFMLMTNFLFFGGLVWLGLAEISAIMYVTPLITTLLSVPVLGEQVGWRRLLSVLAGLIGAVAWIAVFRVMTQIDLVQGVMRLAGLIARRGGDVARSATKRSPRSLR